MAGRKRASTGDAEGSSTTRKRSRVVDPHAGAKEFVDKVIDAGDSDNFTFPVDNNELFSQIHDVAQYVRSLEEQVKAANNAVADAVEAKKKSPEELEAAAEKIRKAAVAGIKKQMSWKPSCKQNSAKWLYDGICPDPEVFGHIFNQGGPPKFKQKKFTKEEFQHLVGSIQAAARYNALYITGTHVNVRWNDSGEFKFSGTYGIS
ncbi:hypothetical protein PHLGIDRAFT_183747 [Phlebiopsis gigantea 11061_1 CR5-6]|uniref:Uncharacterized protein n=1 Tax=Phlebiopsis gigantea (strain 11061_1 CR5-6) TaxID=745531 RepID=A0A0C3SCE7_PHLG1|nr:hypothetical protein PHLGIDRAFT_183747 [Phlebiopsis gigantea 11061_1 CR5-6]